MTRKFYGFTEFKGYSCLVENKEDCFLLWHSRMYRSDIFEIEMEDKDVEKYLVSDITKLGKYGLISGIRGVFSNIENFLGDTLPKKKCNKDTNKLALKIISINNQEILTDGYEREFKVYYFNENKKFQPKKYKEKFNYKIINNYKNLKNIYFSMIVNDENENMKNREMIVFDLINEKGLIFNYLKIFNKNITFRKYIKLLYRNYHFEKMMNR